METEKDRIVFLKGEKVILRPRRKETDLEKNLVWINDPEVTQYLASYLPFSFDEENDWFDSLKSRQNDLQLAIETVSGVLIGSIGLHNIHEKDKQYILRFWASMNEV